jgi:hypothetical protein
MQWSLLVDPNLTQNKNTNRDPIGLLQTPEPKIRRSASANDEWASSTLNSPIGVGE